MGMVVGFYILAPGISILKQFKTDGSAQRAVRPSKWVSCH